MKPVFFIIFLFAFYSKAAAQFLLGVEAAYTNNHLHTDISNRMATRNKNGNSFSLGIWCQYNLSCLVDLETGIHLVRKNYAFVRTGEYRGVYQTFINSYLQLPVEAKVKVATLNKTDITLNSGLFVSYWSFAKVEGAMPNIFNSINNTGANGQVSQSLAVTAYAEKYNFNAITDNRIELGWIAGLSANYALSKKYAVSIECKYLQALTGQQKEYTVNQIPKYNQTCSIAAKCFMRLDSKRVKHNEN